MTTRRGFLAAALAACAAPAYVKAGILMPVKTIWTPPQRVCHGVYDGIDDTFRTQEIDLPLGMNGGRVWQDAAGTIPVTAPGQPIGRIEHGVMVNGRWMPLWQENATLRPTFGVDEKGPHAAFRGGRGHDEYLIGDSVPELAAAGPWPKTPALEFAARAAARPPFALRNIAITTP